MEDIAKLTDSISISPQRNIQLSSEGRGQLIETEAIRSASHRDLIAISEAWEILEWLLSNEIIKIRTLELHISFGSSPGAVEQLDCRSEHRIC